MNIHVARLLLIPFLFVATSSLAQEASTDRTVEFQKMANEFRKKHQIPGLGMAVGLNGQIVFAAGSGMSDMENAVKATEDTVFRTASIAKPMTAVAVLQLVDQGKQFCLRHSDG